MDEKYLSMLRSRYNNDSDFQKAVQTVAVSLIISELSNEDIAMVADMAAAVALNHLEKEKLDEAVEN